MSFDEALKVAQGLGYAETIDPSADVDGIDACRKISILASLIFGKMCIRDRLFVDCIGGYGLAGVKTGEFGADMQVSLVNDGPVTIVMDTEEWKRG